MKKLPKTTNCILDLSEGWLTIWFNRPEKRNALSLDLINEIILTLESIYDDRSVRGIIFRGKEKFFCSGADLESLKQIASAGKKSRNMAFNMSIRVGKLFEAISMAPQITISSVEGAAMAGAFGIACATDFLVTMSDAKYALTETKIGLTPAQIAPYVIKRLGFSNAKRLMLMGTLFNGKKAFEMGMADYVADNEIEFSEQINSIKNQVNKCAPSAIGVTKKILNSHYNIDAEEAALLFSNCVIHEEGLEGLASFFEKRKPYWNK